MKDMKKEELIKLVLDVISKEQRPITRNILLKKLIKFRTNREYIKDVKFNDVINQLISLANIKELSKTKYLVKGYINGKIDESQTYQGLIYINSSNSGFISLNEENKAKYFVHHTNLNGALNGDIVAFQTMEMPEKSDLINAVITKVIYHAKDFYTCLFNKKENTYECIPDDPKMYYQIKLDDISGLVDGQKILVKIKKYEDKIAYGTVSRIIGHKSDVGADILSIVLDKGVEPDFSDEVLDYSKSLKLNIDQHQRQIRKDLTKLNIVTIDPSTSKDFDDAIYVEKNSEHTYKLYVCIADVAHYVKLDDILDKSAITRGTSIYLVDRVIPMLPHILSDDICSLVQGKERLTTTCEMIIDDTGKIQNIDVYPSIINSHRRFAYNEVNDFFNQKSDLANDSQEIKQMLTVARELHHILNKTKYKYERGYINFNIPEAQIILDKQGFPVEIKLHETGEAQNMIENFMVCANEAVTLFAHKNHIPFVYRVHDKPDEEKLKSLVCETKKLNFKITTDLKNIQPSDIAKWLFDNQKNPNLDLINILLLRSMAKAEYDTKNVGHFGLALENYTHYTSPIRRYPDLMVGRLFWMYHFDRNSYSDSQRETFKNNLKKYCKLSSKNELIAIECERDTNSMKFAEYMTCHIGDEFTGTVTSVSQFGVFVQLPNTIEGLIRLVNLKNDFYSYNKDTNELIGRTTGLRFSLGTKVKVKCVGASKELRKINFELVQHLGNRR